MAAASFRPLLQPVSPSSESSYDETSPTPLDELLDRIMSHLVAQKAEKKRLQAKKCVIKELVNRRLAEKQPALELALLQAEETAQYDALKRDYAATLSQLDLAVERVCHRAHQRFHRPRT